MHVRPPRRTPIRDSNACTGVVVLLLQNSSGSGAYQRAASHGSIHTVLWGLCVIGGTAIRDEFLSHISDGLVYGLLVAIYLIGWAFYVVPLCPGRAEQLWPRCCVLTFLNPQALYSNKFQLAFLTACFWCVCN